MLPKLLTTLFVGAVATVALAADKPAMPTINLGRTSIAAISGSSVKELGPTEEPAEAKADEVAQPKAGTAARSPEAQDRRNRELAVRPFLFGACITAGAIVGMLLISRWQRRKGNHVQ